MISVRRAFTGHTTAPLYHQVREGAGYNPDNVWVIGGYSTPVTIHATALPYGNREDGILGDQLSATQIGERIPSYFQVHSTQELPINSYLTIYGHTYKLLRDGKYEAAGYWSTLVERIDNKELAEGWEATTTGIKEVE